jgi:hypothetical protein
MSLIWCPKYNFEALDEADCYYCDECGPGKACVYVQAEKELKENEEKGNKND